MNLGYHGQPGIYVTPKLSFSNSKGEYWSKEICTTIGGVEARWCSHGTHFAPITHFTYHHKGRYAGHYYTNCNFCLPAYNAASHIQKQNLRAVFQDAKAAGQIVYNTANPPRQCSHCFGYSNPPPDHPGQPRTFEQNDDGTWLATCDWCRNTYSRAWEQIQQEAAINGNQVKACRRCCNIKLRTDFVVQTWTGFQVRSRCNVCRPLDAVQAANSNKMLFNKKSFEKNSYLDTFGCAGYGDMGDIMDDEKDCACPFGFDKFDVGFEDLVEEVRLLAGASFTTALDFHHPGPKNNNASGIRHDDTRHTEIWDHCELTCKFCHSLHHAMKYDAPNPTRMAIVVYKLEQIYEHGCGGPGQDERGNDEECPFGFHKGPTLENQLHELVHNFEAFRVVKLFNNDHDNRRQHRYGDPSKAHSLADYKHRIQGCTLRCKMCDAIKTHRSGDNVPLHCVLGP